MNTRNLAISASNSPEDQRRFNMKQKSKQMIEPDEIQQMKQGWGVNTSSRLNKSNHFKKNSGLA
jgi:hypothetical protein